MRSEDDEALESQAIRDLLGLVEAIKASADALGAEAGRASYHLEMARLEIEVSLKRRRRNTCPTF